MNALPWSQRQLPFGKGADEFPNLIERLRGTPARVADLLSNQSIERLVLRVQGRWCAMEHVAHLLLLDQRFHARIDDFLALRPTLCRIELGDQHHWLELTRSRHPGDLLEEYRLTRLDLVRRTSALQGHFLQHKAVHPCLGSAYTPVDMALWIAEHDDHHLLAMRAALGAFEA